MSDTELRLREALRAGAELITADDPPDLLLAPRRRSPWWLVAAAAVMIVAVAALALGLRHGSTGAPPANRSTGTGVSTSPPPSPDSLHPVTCEIAIPGRWSAEISSGHVPLPGSGALSLLGVDRSGAAVVARSRPKQQIVRVSGAHSLQTLYTAPTSAPGQGNLRIGAGRVEGHWSVFTLLAGAGQGRVAGIDALDLDTGAVRVVRDAGLAGQLIVQPPILVGGTVYWSEVTNAGRGHVYSYDVSTQRKRTLDTGVVLGPSTVGGGVYWQKSGRLVTYRVGSLPPGMAVQPGKGFNILLSDGDTQAWTQQIGENFVIKMRTGSETPVTVVRGRELDVPVVPLVLSAHFLVYNDGSKMLALDTRTGASTELARNSAQAAAFRGSLAVIPIGDTSVIPSDYPLSLLDMTRLPGLHC